MRLRRSKPLRRVGSLMTAPVVTAKPSASLEEVARLMLDQRVGSVVIVDPSEESRVVGIVTESDFDVREDPVPLAIFRWPRLFGEAVWSGRSLEHLYAIARSHTAGEIMSSPVVTVDETSPVWDAIRLMVDRDVKRLPVVGSGRLVGILSRHDLLKHLVAEP